MDLGQFELGFGFGYLFRFYFFLYILNGTLSEVLVFIIVLLEEFKVSLELIDDFGYLLLGFRTFGGDFGGWTNGVMKFGLGFGLMSRDESLAVRTTLKHVNI